MGDALRRLRGQGLVSRLPPPEDYDPGVGCALAVIFGLAMWAGMILTIAVAHGWRP